MWSLLAWAAVTVLACARSAYWQRRNDQKPASDRDGRRGRTCVAHTAPVSEDGGFHGVMQLVRAGEYLDSIPRPRSSGTGTSLRPPVRHAPRFADTTMIRHRRSGGVARRAVPRRVGPMRCRAQPAAECRSWRRPCARPDAARRPGWWNGGLPVAESCNRRGISCVETCLPFGPAQLTRSRPAPW
jgi:hypothetical protein